MTARGLFVLRIAYRAIAVAVEIVSVAIHSNREWLLVAALCWIAGWHFPRVVALGVLTTTFGGGFDDHP